jgi:hypothetical protein
MYKNLRYTGAFLSKRIDNSSGVVKCKTAMCLSSILNEFENILGRSIKSGTSFFKRIGWLSFLYTYISTIVLLTAWNGNCLRSKVKPY